MHSKFYTLIVVCHTLLWSTADFTFYFIRSIYDHLERPKRQSWNKEVIIVTVIWVGIPILSNIYAAL